MSDGFRRSLAGLALVMLSLACGQAAPGPGTTAGDPEPDAEAPAVKPDGAGPVPGKPDSAPAPADPAPDAGARLDLPPPADLPPPTADTAAAPSAVLIYTRATGYVHASIGAEAMALKRVLAPLGITATISEDPALFTAEKLAPFAAVILVSSTDRPFGDPGTAAIAALEAHVRGGRALAGVHAASSAYENSPAFMALLGGHFKEHPGGVRMGRCQPEGTHPSVVKLPAIVSTTDEFYVFDTYNDANVVDLRCDALNGGTKLPIAWHRQEGQGRVFYSALGHDAKEWEGKRLLEDHVLPGILWAMGR